MGNVPDTCTTKWIKNNTDLAHIASDLERILGNAKHFFQTVFENQDRSREADDQVGTFEQALKSDYEGPLSTLPREPSQATARFTLDLLASAAFRAIVQLLAEEKAERIYASRVNGSMKKAAEEALSNELRIGYESANEVLKTRRTIPPRLY